MEPFPSKVEDARKARQQADHARFLRQRAKKNRQTQQAQRGAYSYLSAELRNRIGPAVRAATKRYERGGRPYAELRLTSGIKKIWVHMSNDMKIKLK